MLRYLAHLAVTAAIGTMSLFGTPDRVQAQTYPIDCAILLCLSGGWPASVPCSQARAEFIRRITPWPVEPPLQIWRCPMGASFERDGDAGAAARIYDVLFNSYEGTPPYLSPNEALAASSKAAVALNAANSENPWPESFALRLVRDRADIDISGPEFDFVRSIRVFDVRFARQRESGQDGDCSRSAVVVLGTYGTQGEFSWQSSSIDALPEAHIGLEGWGEYCPSIYHRSVFVDWRDYQGNYGFEQVNY